MAGIIINEDFENFMASRPMEKMTEAGLKGQIDNYSGKQVEMIVFCGNGMRAMFDSHVFEPLWKDMEELPDGRLMYRGVEVTNDPLPVKNNAMNCKRLYENNKNPFKTRIDYARSKGIKAGASMRMNDVHWALKPEFLMHSDFWRKHPEFRRAAYQPTWTGQALDYAIPEVRERSLALIREYLERFEFDAIEVDWMRTPPHFRPGFEAQGLRILNDFMQQVRGIADKTAEKTGHSVDVLVRVPTDPDIARRHGFDVVRWVKEKWVSHVTVTNHYATTDFDPPLELWRSLLGDEVSLAAGMDINCRQNFNVPLGFRNTEDIIKGYAASFLYRGANKLYFFNHMDGNKSCMYDFNQFKRVIDCAGSPETVEPEKRRHVVTFNDMNAPGTPFKGPLLPLKVDAYNAEIRINVGGGTANRNAFVILVTDTLNEMTKVRLNTVYCTKCTMPDEYEKPLADGTFSAWQISAEVLHDGDNVIEIEAGQEEIYVNWCEILIQVKE